MKKFVIENEFWELFPTAKIGIVVANDIDNTIKDEAKYAPMLAAAEKGDLVAWCGPGHRREFRALVRAIAERLLLAQPAGAPVVGLVLFHFQREGGK